MLPKQFKHAREGRIGIALGVFRQEFVRQQPAIRSPGNDVREGTAAIDPELPAPTE
jgi:hypothetical protein